MQRSFWPNLLSALRIGLMPAALSAALLGSRGWFMALIAAALVTDALDGYVARRLRASSELGRKLDSAADYLVLLVGLPGTALLWPAEVHRELPWILTGLAAFFVSIAHGFLRLGRVPCYHSWAARIGTLGCALALIPLLNGGTAGPFHFAIGVQVVAAVEGIVIAWLVPGHQGVMPTVWHAWRWRRSARAGLTKSAASPTPEGE